MPRRIVVVGNGIAGLTAGDALRSAGFDGELTVIGEERHAPYSRPALSKSALLDDGEITSHLLPEPSHGATEILGIKAVGLDTERRIVRLGDGTDVAYDGLVIASGSRARRLIADGPETRDSVELTLRALDDVTELRRRIADRPSVIVIGGGALGMEVASGCAALGCEVTLVSRRDPLSALLGSSLSEIFVTAARSAGVTVLTSSSISMTQRGGRASVLLDDGTTLDAGLVVSAIGDVPNTEWLASSGLLTGGDLRVDARGRVRSDIVAAGDVAAFPTTRGVRRVPLWTSALEQAKVAGAALMHGDDAAELAFQPYFWTEQFGLSLKACGHLPVVGQPTLVDGDPREGRGLMTWTHADGSGTAAALNYRIPVPKLRALSRQAGSAAAA